MILGRKLVASALAFAVAMGPSALVLADPVIVNGDFTKASNGTTLTNGVYLPNSPIQGWSTNGYNFDYLGTKPGQNVGGVAMKGVTSSGLPSGYFTTGNYVAADANFVVGALNQTVGGLNVDQSYNVSFYWAASQQSGFGGDPVYAGWDVSLGSGAAQSTGLGTYNGTFLGWSEETFTFKATSASEVLSFLATTTTGGEPPFALLADVSITAAVPEPGSLILVGLGAIGIGVARLVRRKKPVAA